MVNSSGHTNEGGRMTPELVRARF